MDGRARGHDRDDRDYRHHWHHGYRVIYTRPLGSDWYLHAHVGQRVPVEVYRYGYRLPSHARVHHLQSGITELVVADQIIRILDATQTIVNVSR